MHILRNKNPLPMGGGVALLPGHYLFEDADAAQAMIMAGGGECEVSPAAPEVRLLDMDSAYAPTITIVRPGRYGDLILLTPVLREIKRRWPACTLQLATLPQYREAVLGLPYIDGFLNYPLPMDRNYGIVLSLEVTRELGKREGEIHMTDLFAERLGIDGLQEKKPDFYLSMDERNWAHDVYPRTKAKRVAIQIKSSTPSRDYPVIPMGEVIRRLYGRGWDVLLLGLPNQIEGKSKDRLVNCAADKLTFRQSAAVVATVDVFLGPDSSLIHVAGALGIPAIGLFSVVPWQLRTAYCPKTFVIQAKNGCDMAPCFHAPRGQMGFPVTGPCQKVRKCCALDSIEPHEIVGRIEQHVANS